MKPILVTGASGRLGRAFTQACRDHGLACRPTAHDELDIADAVEVERMLGEVQPWLVVNTAGYGKVDRAEDDEVRCHRDNAVGAEILARACARHRLSFLTYSSDLVFDGKQREPYQEGDKPRPLSVYGRSKASAEDRVMSALPGALVIRTGVLFGADDELDFVRWTQRTLGAGRSVAAAEDVVVSPTYIPDVVEASLELALGGDRGVYHLANPSAITWADFARQAARLAGADDSKVVPVPGRALPWRAPRPCYSALQSKRGERLPSLDDALRRYQNRPAATAAAPPAVGTTASTGRSARRSFQNM